MKATNLESTALKSARLLSGALCTAAGIAKAFPQMENVANVLNDMALANSGTILDGISKQIALHSTFFTVLAGASLFASGTAFLLNRFIYLACIGQLIMFLAFIVLLYRLHPYIIIVDAPFIITALSLLIGTRRKK